MRRILLIAGILLVGCSGDRRIHHVSGQVTYEGKPLPYGIIHFDPDVMKNNDGPQGYALIKNGEYATVAQGGKGVFGGAYIVRIEGFDGKSSGEFALGRPLFTKFKQAVDLPQSTTTLNFDVPEEKR